MLERRGSFSASGPLKVLESFLRHYLVAAGLACMELVVMPGRRLRFIPYGSSL